jgi:hypothetical protein
LTLSSQRLKINSNVLLGVPIKNVLQRVVAHGIVRLLRIPYPNGSQSVLRIAIPVGFFGMIFDAAPSVKNEEAGATLIASSVLSMITLAIATMGLALK